MLKKSLSILLSVVMLLALCPIVIFGAMPTTELTVVDEVVSAGTTGVSVDNFDQIAVGTTVDDYPRNTASTVFRLESRQYSPMTIVSAEDALNPEDNVLLMKRGTSGNGALYSKRFNVQSGYVNEITYDFRFRQLPDAETIGTTTTTKFLGYSGGGGIDLTYDANAGKWKMWSSGQGTTGGVTYPELDKWYTARATVDGNGLLKTYMLIKETGEVLVSANRASCGSGALSGTPSFLIGTIPRLLATENDSVQVEFNNAKLAVYSQAENNPAVSKSSLDKNLQAVPIDTKTIELTFDQDIAVMPDTVTITPENAAAVTATVAKVSGKLNTYTLTPSNVFEGIKLHTIDLSGFENSAGTSADNFIFTTAAAAPLVVSSTPEDGATNVSAETKALSLTFDQPMTDYPDSLNIADGVNAEVTTEDNITFTLNWTADLDGSTTYSVSLAEFKNAEGKAPSQEAISFTTEFTGIVTETDDFETKVWTDKSWNGKYNGSVLYHNYEYGAPDIAIFAQVEGYNGGNALQISTGASSHQYLRTFRTKNTYSLADGEKFVATWRFNLKDMAVLDADNNKGGSLIRLGGCSTSADSTWGSCVAEITTRNGKPFINHSYDNVLMGRELDEDHWYNIYYLIESGAQTIYVVDAEGENKGTLVYKRSKKGESTIPTLSAASPVYIHLANGTKSVLEGITYNESQSFILDDFTLWRVKPSVKGQKLYLTESDEGAVLDKNDENNSSITMTFNQPVMAEPTMFELYKGTDKNTLAYSTVNAKWTDFCTQEVSFSNLDYGTEYTLDYSGMTAVSSAELKDAAAAVIGFSTDAAPTEMSVSGDISCTGLNAGDKIIFDLYSKSNETAKVIAAFYTRSFPEKLEGIEIADVNAVAGESVPAEISFTKAHTADYIKLFVWNGKVAPMAEIYDVYAPVDSLDVLMIGNSLSEDAGRYFNDMAEAGGLTLDLTVKGVGGASLAHHADNLKAELAGRTVEEAKQGMADETLDRALYFTYKNGVIQPNSDESQLLLPALTQKQYDVISLQQFSAYTDAAFEESLPYLAEEIRKLQPNAQIILYQTWAFKDNTKEARNYYFTNTIEPAINKWAAYTGANVENITVDAKPMKIVAAGKAFYLADNKHSWCETPYTAGEGDTDAEAKNDVTEKMRGSLGLWRDYNHASYYGCYLADAVWFETLTGKKAPVGTAENPVVAAPDGISAEDHIERLTKLSDIAHQVVLDQKN